MISKELKEFHEMWELQEHLRLPPEDPQRLLKTVMELHDEIEVRIWDTPQELKLTREFRRIQELRETPDAIMKDLQELSQASQEQEKPYGATEYLPDEDPQQHPQMPLVPPEELGYEEYSLYQDSAHQEPTH